MHFTTPTALIVSADEADSSHFAGILKVKGFWVNCAHSIAEAEQWLGDNTPDLALIALDMPQGDSLQLLKHASLQGKAEIILTSHKEDIERVRRGISAGASYYFSCPSDERFLMALLNDMVAEISPQAPGQDSLSNVTPIDQFGLLRGRSRPMRELYRTIRRVAPTDTSVFVYGESGTGKELVAQTIHLISERREGPFVALNCGAIPKDLIESELFGHEKGSFSGAEKRHTGYFERAHTGTLFLDEVTEMPSDLQIKLLRVLESGRYRPIGGEKDKSSDVRIVAASNRDPEQAVSENKLRDDLYYRLAGFPIEVPPLRQRDDDVKGLVQFFLNKLNNDSGTQKTISPEALTALQGYHWPGNVRELHSVISQAHIMANSTITESNLPNLREVRNSPAAEPKRMGPGMLNIQVGETLRSAEKKLILATLQQYHRNKAQCAKVLGVSLKTLYNRLNEYKAEEAEAAASANKESKPEEAPPFKESG